MNIYAGKYFIDLWIPEINYLLISFTCWPDYLKWLRCWRFTSKNVVDFTVKVWEFGPVRIRISCKKRKGDL